MPRQHAIAVLITETTVHCGVGQDVGPVDLPIQRDKVTRTPIVFGSSLKGGWRDAIHDGQGEATAASLFGPRVDPDNPGQDLEQGKVGVGEARTLLYPVASPVGLFGYVTCPSEVARLRRAVAVSGVPGPAGWPTVSIDDEEAALTSGPQLHFEDLERSTIALREFTFTATVDAGLGQLAAWLAEAVPGGPEVDYWRDAIRARTVMVSDGQFTAMVDPATVVTRVQLVPGKKVVATGMLLTEEVLPADVVLWAPLTAETGRLDELVGHLPQVVNVGGDETIGRGAIRVNILKGAQP